MHIQDIASVLHYEDLRDVILVGHSYGGMVITGVADGAARSGSASSSTWTPPTPENGESLVDVAGPMMEIGRGRTGGTVDGVELVLLPAPGRRRCSTG